MEMTQVTEQATDAQTDKYTFDWAELAFGSKKPVSSLEATFITAPRKLSQERMKQLVKQYLPKGNIVIGVAKEPHVLGLEDNPAFTMLQRSDVDQLLQTVNANSPKYKIYTLQYSQRDLQYILEKITFRHVALVRGSWYTVFHASPSFYVMAQKGVPYEYISPFAGDQEAKDGAIELQKAVDAQYRLPTTGTFTAAQMLELASITAKRSLATDYQTGAVIGVSKKGKYTPLLAAYNKVVPYQTYAMHHGNTREEHFSPAQDLNYYDTVHAEVALLIQAAQNGIKLDGTTLFINLMPCPTCSRMLAETNITEVVYAIDHSDGYALRMLEAAGKKVSRIAPLNSTS